MLSTMRHVRRGTQISQWTAAGQWVSRRSMSSPAPAAATARSPPGWTPQPTVTRERVVAPDYTPSLWDRVFNNSKMPRVSMTLPFPVQLPKTVATQPHSATESSDTPQPLQQEQSQLSEEPTVTTLPNGHTKSRQTAQCPVALLIVAAGACGVLSGLRVASVLSPSPVASVGVLCDLGSRYESPELSGISHFLEQMSLKSTSNRTDFRLVREMQKMGANVVCTSSRETFSFAADCLREHVPAIVGTFADLIQHSIFHVEELMEEKELWEQGKDERDKQMESVIMEAVHEAAYLNNTLGLPHLAPLHNLHAFTADRLKEYQRTYFTPKRMIITAVGVDHQQLVDLVQAVFTELDPDVVDPTQRAPARYTGGDVRQHKKGDEGLAHIALVFEGVSWHDRELLPMCVLQTMMGGGGSFSTGGPGKGMYSRLYSDVVNKHDWVESAVCFNCIYSDSGLFGVYGTALPDKAKQLVDVLSSALLSMASRQPDDEELNRAKAQLQSSLAMESEHRVTRHEEIGRQLLTYGKYTTITELSRQVAQVTAGDVQRVARRILRTPLSVAAIGDLSHCPRYDQIAQRFTDAAKQSGDRSGSTGSWRQDERM